MQRIALSLLLFSVAVGAEGWPFGKGRSGFSRLDLYNLGLIGAKAGDANREPKPNTPPSGGVQQVEQTANDGDQGPARLRVDVLYPDGAAARAGVRIGDIIVGVSGARFDKGSVTALAKVLRKAESSKGEVTLLIERNGKKQKIKVPIPKAGSHAAKPTTGKGRQALVDAALQWLAKRQAQDGGYAETLSGQNGAVVQASLAGLAWLGSGDEKYADNVQRAAVWVAARVQKLGESPFGKPAPGKPSWNQNNWGFAHACIFLGEYHKGKPNRTVLAALHFAAQRLVDTQEQSGGWAHGPGGKNGLGYLELNIVTGLALSGLGLARQNGFEVPAATLKRAGEYLKKSSSGGGIGYSVVNNGGGNIGRSAGCWLGYMALGLGKTKLGKSMRSYVKREAGNVFGGHASLMQHILHAGVAAHAQGGAVQREFWKTMRQSLVLARAPDGSFQARPWHETLNMGSNTDVTFGEVWTTAAWTIVLVSDPKNYPGYPGWTGR